MHPRPHRRGYVLTRAYAYSQERVIIEDDVEVRLAARQEPVTDQSLQSSPEDAVFSEEEASDERDASAGRVCAAGPQPDLR